MVTRIHNISGLILFLRIKKIILNTVSGVTFVGVA